MTITILYEDNASINNLLDIAKTVLYTSVLGRTLYRYRYYLIPIIMMKMKENTDVTTITVVDTISLVIIALK